MSWCYGRYLGLSLIALSAGATLQACESLTCPSFKYIQKSATTGVLTWWNWQTLYIRMLCYFLEQLCTCLPITVADRRKVHKFSLDNLKVYLVHHEQPLQRVVIKKNPGLQITTLQPGLKSWMQDFHPLHSILGTTQLSWWFKKNSNLDVSYQRVIILSWLL